MSYAWRVAFYYCFCRYLPHICGYKTQKTFHRPTVSTLSSSQYQPNLISWLRYIIFIFYLLLMRWGNSSGGNLFINFTYRKREFHASHRTSCYTTHFPKARDTIQPPFHPFPFYPSFALPSILHLVTQQPPRSESEPSHLAFAYLPLPPQAATPVARRHPPALWKRAGSHTRIWVCCMSRDGKFPAGLVAFWGWIETWFWIVVFLVFGILWMGEGDRLVYEAGVWGVLRVL